MTASSTFTVGLVQMAVTGDRATTVTAAIEKIREAAAKGAQIISLQELFNAPYFCKSLKLERFDIAEPIPGPTVVQLQQVAQELGVVLVVPIYEKQTAGIYRNSAAVVDADGTLLGTYAKMHIPHDPMFEEKYYFTPGDVGPDLRSDVHPGINGFRVWQTKFAKIGVLICWDQWYPEGARLTALRGAEILFYPTAIGWHPHEKEQYGASQQDAWRTIQRSHSIANGVYVAGVNRVGHETTIPGTPGIEFWGKTFLSDPFGVIVAEADSESEQIVIGEVDPARIEEVRRNWPFLRDRRIDAYGDIEKRFID